MDENLNSIDHYDGGVGDIGDRGQIGQQHIELVTVVIRFKIYFCHQHLCHQHEENPPFTVFSKNFNDDKLSQFRFIFLKIEFKLLFEIVN